MSLAAGRWIARGPFHSGAPQLGLLAVSALGLGCGSSNNGSKASGTSVAAVDFSFAPKQITVKTGEAVTWTNQGQTTHTVNGPGFFSQALDPGKKYTHRFSKAGSFKYLCTLHPTQMQGTIVVHG